MPMPASCELGRGSPSKRAMAAVAAATASRHRRQGPRTWTTTIAHARGGAHEGTRSLGVGDAHVQRAGAADGQRDLAEPLPRDPRAVAPQGGAGEGGGDRRDHHLGRPRQPPGGQGDGEGEVGGGGSDQAGDDADHEGDEEVAAVEGVDEQPRIGH